MTDSLGVSRASVRTATQQLVGIGVLNTVYGKEAYLLTDNFDDMLHSEIVVNPERKFPAIAHEFQIHSDAETFDRMHRGARYLLDIKPVGKWPAHWARISQSS